MVKMHMTACLLASALVAAPALAQTSTTQNPPGQTPPVGNAPNVGAGNTNMQGSGNFITRREPGMYRASELIGMDVYGTNNEDIGEVGDVLVDRTGQVRAVVVDVGGFLGLGETHVAVPMQALQFRPQNQQNASATGSIGGTTSSTNNAAGTTATTGSANQNTAARTNNSQQNAGAGANAGMPDMIVLVMTKEQLQNAPKFQDDNQGAATGTSPARPNTSAPVGSTGTGTTAPRQ